MTESIKSYCPVQMGSSEEQTVILVVSVSWAFVGTQDEKGTCCRSGFYLPWKWPQWKSVKHPFPYYSRHKPSAKTLPLFTLYLECLSQDQMQISAASQSLWKLSYAQGPPLLSTSGCLLFFTCSTQRMLPLLLVFSLNHVIYERFSGILFIPHPEGQQNAFLMKTLHWELKEVWTKRQDTFCPWFCSERREGTLSRTLNLPLFLSSVY